MDRSPSFRTHLGTWPNTAELILWLSALTPTNFPTDSLSREEINGLLSELGYKGEPA